MGPKARRNRGDLSQLIVRLQGELQERQEQLAEELTRNKAEKRRVRLLSALSHTNGVFSGVLARPFAGLPPIPPEPTAADQLEGELAALRASTAHDGAVSANGSSATGAGTQPGGDEAPAGRGGEDRGAGGVGTGSMDEPAWGSLPAIKMTAVEMISCLAGLYMRRTSRDAFVSEWRVGVGELAMLLHQHGQGAATEEKIQEVVQVLVSRLGALLLFQPEMCMDVLYHDLATGEPGEPDSGIWDRMAESMNLNQKQAGMLALMDRLWVDASSRMRHTREQLAQWGQRHPADLEVQEAVVEGLEQAQVEFLMGVSTFWIVMLTALLRPHQAAEILVQSWPRIPLLLGILGACSRMHDMYDAQGWPGHKGGLATDTGPFSRLKSRQAFQQVPSIKLQGRSG